MNEDKVEAAKPEAEKPDMDEAAAAAVESAEAPVQEKLPEVKGPKMRKKATGILNEAVLKVLVTHNPKRESSNAFKVFAIYLEVKPDTVQKALDAGIGKDHLAYDLIHGFISIAGAKVEEYEVQSRGPRTPSAIAEEVVAGAEGEEEAEGEDNDGF